jgi:signal transduction histidine kinase
MSPQGVRRARWPWAVLALGFLAGSVGLAFVILKQEAAVGDAMNFLAFMGMGVVGALILSRAPRNVIGGLLLLVSTTVALAFGTTEAASYAYRAGERSTAVWLAWPGNTLWTVGIFPLLVLLPLLFPDGRLLSGRWRIVAWVGLGMAGLALVTLGIGVPTLVVDVDVAGRDVMIENPLHVPALAFLEALGGAMWVALLTLFALSVASMVLRFRRSTGIERQQLKWFAFAAVILVVYFLISAALESLGISEGAVGEVISGILFLGIPVTVGIAILQYRLWDLDVVVKKAVVAGTLVVLAIAAYAATVALIGSVVTTDRPAILFAIALALGIAFRPVVRIARRLADRLVYGRRATPYEVLTEFSERLGGSYGTEDVLPRMAQILAEGTGAEVARIWLLVGGELRPEAVWPAGAPASAPAARGASGLEVLGETVVEVRDKGDLLGALSVRMPASDPMSPTKEKLVRDLAAQAGLVLRNVRLVEDLRASRQRLVAAQDEERRRLERNIHDGAQQQLVALTVKARLARQLAERDPSKAAEMLAEIEEETQGALEDLRDLARGIYPPLLADKGLVAALEAQSRKAPIRVSVAAEGVGRYPADIEATIYFCTLEALQNVAKYAEAVTTTVRVSQANGTVGFAVEDDGRGFDPSQITAGSGLQGMADRLAAVGGSLVVDSSPGRGTRVAGRVPVTTE